MAETSWPTVAGSRAVTDDQFELMSTHWSADGVDANLTTTPVFGDSSGRQVKVRSGVDAIVGGHGYNSGGSDLTKSISANASGSTRFDAVVLGLDRTTWAVTSYVKTGTPGAGTPPALTRNARGSSAGVWEIPLAMVQVTNGAATISAGDVTNIAWYVQGETVVTTSTNPLQPPAADYTRMKHSDTGHEFDSIAGAWRRTPWQTAWGVIGGRRYTAGAASAIVTLGGTSEFASTQTSGAVQLRANRRYRLRAYIRLYTSVSTAYVILRLRETNVSGTIRAEMQVTNANQSVIFDHELVGEYSPSVDESKTFVVTAQSNTGTWNLYAGTSTGYLTAVYVEDVGPSLPNVVTNV